MKTWPSLKKRLYLVEIPFNDNNPQKTILKFGSEQAFKDRSESLRFKQFIVAVLRREEAFPGSQGTWSYNKGAEDYCHYMNFLDDWMPSQLDALVKAHRETVSDAFEEQVSAAMVFDPNLPNRSLSERLSKLVTTRDVLEESINLQTGLRNWDAFLEGHLAKWSKMSGCLAGGLFEEIDTR